MSTPFRKSTASQVMQFVMVDSTTALPKTGLSIASTDIKLIFEGGTTQTSKNSGGATEIGSTGTYYCTFDATDTATLGRLHIDIQKSGALPYFKDTEVLPSAIWDSLYAASGGAIPNVASGSAGALLVDGTGTAAISNSSGKVLLQATQSGVTIPTVTTVTNQLTGAAIATAVWTDTVAGDFTTALSVGKSIMNGVSLGTGLTIARCMLVDTATTVTNQLTAAAIATGVWQDTTSGDFTVASSIGKCLYISNVVPGAAGGHFIAGSNAATSITTALTANIIGNITGTLSTVTTLTNLPAITANWLTATGINADAITAAKIADGAIDAATFAAGAINASAIAADAITASKIADSAIDRATFAADTGLQTARSGTAQTGASNSITLDSGASATDGIYTGSQIHITGGTGFPQTPRIIIGYTGSSKIALVSPVWTTTPDNTTTFAIDNKGPANVVSWLANVVTWNSGPDVNVHLYNEITPPTFPTNFSALGIGGTGHITTVDTATSVTNAVTLTSGERDSIAAALLDLAAGVETSLTVRQALREIASSVGGLLSGAGTTTVKTRNTADTKDRLTVTVDADGNRTAITRDLT